MDVEERENKEEEKLIKICPKCHSEENCPDFSNIANICYGALNLWRCKRCGYVADRSLFPEVLESEKPPLIDLSDVKKDYPIMDISVGRVIVKFVVKYGKILGPLGLLIFLYISPYSFMSVLFLPIVFFFCRKIYYFGFRISKNLDVIFLFFNQQKFLFITNLS